MGCAAGGTSLAAHPATILAAFPGAEGSLVGMQQPHHGMTMSEQDKADLRLSLARLRQDHADFDAAIEAMLKTGCDPLQIQRMKKKKLTIKDQLTRLEDQIIPDIIA
jgi:hypothetical protein